ncbi:MAG: autotransporter adhesin [Pseudomonas sp.]|uniref:YadA-like family protein n=1 Tax=Pseudomonas sp. TaxID=306 RepID=UPI000CCAE945|nr:YadA-like family protein [Pseudomonas sp.]PJI47315.1 MAG: autotransporter adhesin [Pseudomonas sp.]
MNRIYRLVWSKSQQCWCVACEFARHSGKGGRALAVLGLGTLGGLYFGDALAADGSNYEKGIAGNPGLYVNDSTDSGCVFVHDTGVTGDMGWKYDGNNSNCKSGDKSTQTGRVLFYGTGSQAAGTNSLTLGDELFVNGGRIGLNNKIDGTNSLAIGNVGTDALGNPTGTRASAADSVAIGNNALASQQNALALGTGAQALAQEGVALGAGSVAGTAAGVAGYVPGGATQAQADAIAVTGSTLGAVAVGDAATGKFRQITGVAAGAQDSDAVNVAQLKGAVGSATADAVMYDNSTHNSVTLGGDTYNSTSKTGGTRITNVARGEGDSDAVNMSQLNETNQQVSNIDNRVSNVDNRVSNVDNRVTNVFGDDSEANIEQNGRGIRYVRTNDNGLPLEDAYAKGQGSTAVGYQAQATGDSALALGRNASATADNSVALGANSTTTADLSRPAYTPYGAPVAGVATGEVSIGTAGAERRVTNVAAGADETDAVNVSQLKGVSDRTEKLAQDALLWDPSANGGQGAFSADHNGTGPNKITQVADGDVNATSTDAINGSQLNQTNQQVANVDNRVTNVFGDDSEANVQENGRGIRYVRTNDNGLPVDDAYAKGQGSTAVGYQAQATGDSALALGRNATATADNSVALGANSTTTADLSHPAFAPNGARVAGVASGEVSVGAAGAERRVTNVAAGADETDAVNVSQLKGVSDRTDQLAQDSLLWDPTANGGNGAYNANHGGRGPNKITNVAAGDISTDSTDAINGSQLYEVTTQINNISLGRTKYFHTTSEKDDSVASGSDSIAVGPAAQASGASSLAMGDGANASADKASAIGSDASASGTAATAMGNGASASGTSSVAMGDGASASGERSSAIGAGANAQANDSVALGAGSVADREGSVSVGSAGNERQIVNVKAGEADTDAVNVSQLRQQGDTINGNISNVDARVTQAGVNISNLQNGTDGMFQVNNSSHLPKPRPSGADSLAGGAGAEATGDNSAAIGTRSRAGGRNATALGNGADAQATNSVALGAGSVADRENSVSVGSAGQERQITNVAAGTATTDAVNVGQLQKSMGDISNQFYDYTDSRYNALRHDLKKQDDILSAGIAGAMAMATLPQPYSPGASMAAVGLGNYRGQGALAVGVSKISDNGKWVTKLQGSTTSQGDTGVSVGVGYQW